MNLTRHLNTSLNQCRLCHRWECSVETGPMLKYGVRHYAHASCGLSRWGIEWLDKQPKWVMGQFPIFSAQHLGILDYLRKRVAEVVA